jgi:(heptosyl)LPS beta-1,4-glucosyltransferase
MYSDDHTAQIATDLGAKVVKFPRVNGYWGGEPRHFAIQQATHEWVLMIDADERLTAPLSDRLRQIAASDRYDCVKFAKLNFYFGDFVYHGPFFLPNQPLFFRKSVYLRNYTGVEEHAHNDWAAVNHLESTLILPTQYHYVHLAYPTIEKYVAKTVGMYARIEGKQYYELGREFSLMRLIGDPIKTFALNYLIKQGYKDGMRGFILNTLFAVYRFTTWANVWLLEELDRQRESSTKSMPKL